jgi:glycosyltransferase involved in cell wall biosynthesis
MKLSIVIPTLNRLEYFKRTISHLLPQVRRNQNEVDLIVSINNSSDETYSYVKSLTVTNDFLTVKLFADRVQICESISRSIDLCEGEYIMVFGDDDIPSPYMIDTILDIIHVESGAGMIHFNRLVGSDRKIDNLTRMKVEQPSFSCRSEYLELNEFVLKYSISPGFISSMVFKKKVWIEGGFIDASDHFGYEFLSRIYAGVSRTTNRSCLYFSFPLVLQRMVITREWNDQWPKFWLLGVPNLLKGLDNEHVTERSIDAWNQDLNRSWLKFYYNLFWASSYKTMYRPLIKQIMNNQRGFIRKSSVFIIINLMPGFFFNFFRKFLYR